MMDYYKLLGIDRNASKEEIKLAYRKMAKKYHPDINKAADANKVIISLNEAKEVLLDDEKRKEYDYKLDSINKSKQFSKNKSETYEEKTKEYKETHSETYVTRSQFYMNYLKNSVDKWWIKLIKSLCVLINSIIFNVARVIVYIIGLIFYLFGELVDYLAGLLILIGVLSLFVVAGKDKPDFIPFIPANVESFIYYSFFAVLIEILRIFIVKGSINLYAALHNLENKLIVAILVK